jgi:hypothetical protein
MAGAGVAAALAVSIALVVRDLPAGKPTEAPPQATAKSAPPKAPVLAPVAPEIAPIVPEPATPAAPPPAALPPEPPLPTQAAKPGNLFDLESLPSPGYIGPGGSTPGLQARRSPAPRTATADERTAPRTRLRLTPEQSAKLSYVLLSHTITQAEAAEFPLRIGATVPPEVLLTPLPRDVADAVPDYTHYSYAIAQNQIVIVVTERREIDSLIPL